jgi:hypothetical protein
MNQRRKPVAQLRQLSRRLGRTLQTWTYAVEQVPPVKQVVGLTSAHPKLLVGGLWMSFLLLTLMSANYLVNPGDLSEQSLSEAALRAKRDPLYPYTSLPADALRQKSRFPLWAFGAIVVSCGVGSMALSRQLIDPPAKRKRRRKATPPATAKPTANPIAKRVAKPAQAKKRIQPGRPRKQTVLAMQQQRAAVQAGDIQLATPGRIESLPLQPVVQAQGQMKGQAPAKLQAKPKPKFQLKSALPLRWPWQRPTQSHLSIVEVAKGEQMQSVSAPPISTPLDSSAKPNRLGPTPRLGLQAPPQPPPVFQLPPNLRTPPQATPDQTERADSEILDWGDLSLADAVDLRKQRSLTTWI